MDIQLGFELATEVTRKIVLFPDNRK